ncbi:MAG TPA: hypothetical protein VJQ54_17675 [Candidatus Sulfotelmatobacter sp.]|nr:hypothetical protein [Candidatus Sulfotelmatobacter sp.]
MLRLRVRKQSRRLILPDLLFLTRFTLVDALSYTGSGKGSSRNAGEQQDLFGRHVF